MSFLDKILDFDVGEIVDRLCFLVRRFVDEAKVNGVVLGMSGGVDSTTTAYLCVKALGKDKVKVLFMPESETFNPEDFEDVKNAANNLGLDVVKTDISNVYRAFLETIPFSDPKNFKVNGNLKSRIRMATLYYFANKFGLLVTGSSNKTELLTGYYTKWGDGASDMLPLGSLYKTQVKKLASYLNIPKKIIDKTPTAGLWIGQTDEDELGVKYEVLDQILYGLVDLKLNPKLVAEKLKISFEVVKKVKGMVETSMHKRCMPPILEIF